MSITRRPAEAFLAERVRTIPPSGIRRFFDMLNEMRDVISLTIGEPDLAIDSFVEGFPAGGLCSSPCQPIWFADLGFPSSSPVAVSDGMVFAADNGGLLHAYSIGAGSGASTPRPDPATLLPDPVLTPTGA